MRALALEWEPEAVVVELEIHNLGSTALELEPSAIFLAWNELEYGPQLDGDEHGSVQLPARLARSSEERHTLRLRYPLGRALTGPGARLLLRGLERDGRAVLDVPGLDLPALPVR